MKQEAAIRALQSRKAKRANEITGLEIARDLLKNVISLGRMFNVDKEVLAPGYTRQRELRAELRQLSFDQKLDGDLMRGLVYANRNNMLVVHDFQPKKPSKKHRLGEARPVEV
jgi:hypothetical protein